MELFVSTFLKYKNNLETTSGKNKAHQRFAESMKGSAIDFMSLIVISFYLTTKKMY